MGHSAARGTTINGTSDSLSHSENHVHATTKYRLGSASGANTRNQPKKINSEPKYGLCAGDGVCLNGH
jgi:hypothetical protein